MRAGPGKCAPGGSLRSSAIFRFSGRTLANASSIAFCPRCQGACIHVSSTPRSSAWPGVTGHRPCGPGRTRLGRHNTNRLADKLVRSPCRQTKPLRHPRHSLGTSAAPIPRQTKSPAPGGSPQGARPGKFAPRGSLRGSAIFHFSGETLANASSIPFCPRCQGACIHVSSTPRSSAWPGVTGHRPCGPGRTRLGRRNLTGWRSSWSALRAAKRSPEDTRGTPWAPRRHPSSDRPRAPLLGVRPWGLAPGSLPLGVRPEVPRSFIFQAEPSPTPLLSHSALVVKERVSRGLRVNLELHFVPGTQARRRVLVGIKIEEGRPPQDPPPRGRRRGREA